VVRLGGHQAHLDGAPTVPGVGTKGPHHARARPEGSRERAHLGAEAGERHAGHVDPEAQVAAADLAHAEHTRVVDGHARGGVALPAWLEPGQVVGDA